VKARIFLVFTAIFALTNGFASPVSEQKTEQYYQSVKANSDSLKAFLQAMPKGGDLHNHESGATYAENLIKYAYNDNLCLNQSTYAVYFNSKCESQDLLNNAIKDPTVYDNIIDAWSMQHFTSSKETGHDHFFQTFGKFSVITNSHRGEILAEITERAASENESYLELMVTADGNESGRLGRDLGWNPDFATMRQKLLAANFDKIIADITTSLDQDEAKQREILACGTSQAKPACQVQVRYLYQVLREQTPEMVFAQLLAGFEAATKDKRVVGLNMVQPEDGKLSMQDYKLQMQMVGYLHKLYPSVLISLHAGELSDSLVPADGLRFHIHDAVDVANANRIGHGVDIVKEDNADVLLKEMAQKQVMVEINLSSNAAILNIDGKDHPLPIYMKYGVPVALSTDDEGVSRSNLANEYYHAATVFQLDYKTLKQFVRNSLNYAFISGDSLWVNNQYNQVNQACRNDELGVDKLSTACDRFLNKNEKARMQWNLEKRFNEFEQQY
jgi:adenosine deaminase